MAMQTTRLLAGVVAVAVILTGCAPGTTVSGSDGPASTTPPPTGAGTPAPAVPASGGGTENRAVSGFTGVELRSIGHLHIEQTGRESLTIEADAEVLPQLTSNVAGGVLVLGVAPGTTVAKSRRIVYRLTVASLDTIAVSGAGDATGSNLRADRLTVDVDGAGAMTLASTVDSQAVTVSGTGHYNGEDIPSATAKVTVDAAGNAVLRGSDRLDATVRGVGSVEYIGGPRVTKHISGVGSVEHR
jgi:Putative auto-transporter adhesin, head GIN domain